MKKTIRYKCGDIKAEGRARRNWVTSPFDVGFNAGPFHYMVRSSGYGELYDEVPWKAMFGVERKKDRDGSDRSCVACRYQNGVLIHNWLEQGRDREVIKFSRTTPISQFGHIYKTTYGTSIGKKQICDKRPTLLRTITDFPQNVFPGHQPELDIDRMIRCAQKPQSCIDLENTATWFSKMEHQKRLAKVSPPPPPPFTYGNDLAKCVD